MIIWRTHLYAAAQVAKISNAGSRVNLTDTDSICLSTLRSMSRWEKYLHAIYKQCPTLYRESEIAKSLMSNLYREWHNILDYSSVPENSVLFQSFFANSPILSTMFRYLSKRRHKRFLTFQSEISFEFLAGVYSPAPKSYHIRSLDLEKATIPNTKPCPDIDIDDIDIDDPIRLVPSKTFLKKCKGTRKNVLDIHGSVSAYINVCKSNKPGRSQTEFSIKKRHLRLYIITRKKIVLTRTIIKRLSYNELKTLFSHFTFPLHFKDLCSKPKIVE